MKKSALYVALHKDLSNTTSYMALQTGRYRTERGFGVTCAVTIIRGRVVYTKTETWIWN